MSKSFIKTPENPGNWFISSWIPMPATAIQIKNEVNIKRDDKNNDSIL